MEREKMSNYKNIPEKYDFENMRAKVISSQNQQNQNYSYSLTIIRSPENSTTGGKLEMGNIPDPKFIDLVFRVFSQYEKDELLRELLQASLESLQDGNVEGIRKTLLAWEYTALWKKDPEMLKKISKEDDTENGINWRDFLASEGV